MKDQAKKRDLVMGTCEEQRPKLPKASLYDPLLVQEERHRAIQEKREQRKKEQKLRQLEESKERRVAKEIPTKTGRGKSINRDIDMVLLHSGSTPQKDFEAELNNDLERIRESKMKIEQDAMDSEIEVRKIKEELKKYKNDIRE